MPAEIALNGSETPAAAGRSLSPRAVREVFRNADLRNLSLASAAFVAGEWAYTFAERSR